jgi:hypothetical protein
MALAGEGVTTIAATLHAEGARTPRGKPLLKTTVHKILTNDLYKGVLPINELAKSVGLNLPAFLGTSGPESHPVSASTGSAPAVVTPTVPQAPVANPPKPSA